MENEILEAYKSLMALWKSGHIDLISLLRKLYFLSKCNIKPNIKNDITFTKEEINKEITEINKVLNRGQPFLTDNANKQFRENLIKNLFFKG